MTDRSNTLTNYGMHVLSKKYPTSEPDRVQQATQNELQIGKLASGCRRRGQEGPMRVHLGVFGKHFERILEIFRSILMLLVCTSD